MLPNKGNSNSKPLVKDERVLTTPPISYFYFKLV